MSEDACIFDCFEQTGVSLERKSSDSTINQYGYNLLEFCKSNDLFILKGCIGSDYITPKLTCKKQKHSGLFMSTPYHFEVIDDFSIHEFSLLVSDAHSPISLILRCASGNVSSIDMSSSIFL